MRYSCLPIRLIIIGSMVILALIIINTNSGRIWVVTGQQTGATGLSTEGKRTAKQTEEADGCSVPLPNFAQPHGDGLRGLSPATTAATATLRWQKPLPQGIGYGGITFSQDGSFLYFKTYGSPQGKVYKVRASDGATVWETNPSVMGFGSFSHAGVTVDEVAGLLYTTGTFSAQPSNGSLIAALKITDGSVVWVKKVSQLDPAIGDVGSSLVFLSPDRQRLYVRDSRLLANIIAVEAATGQFIWKYNIGGSVPLPTFGPLWTDAVSGKTRIAYVNNAVNNTVGVLQDDGAAATLVWSKNVAKGLQFHWWGNAAINAENTRLYLPSFADADNPVSNRLYQRIRYVKLATFADITFGTS